MNSQLLCMASDRPLTYFSGSNNVLFFQWQGENSQKNEIDFDAFSDLLACDADTWIKPDRKMGLYMKQVIVALIAG